MKKIFFKIKMKNRQTIFYKNENIFLIKPGRYYLCNA